MSCLTQSSHVTNAGVDPVSPRLFDVWVDKNVSFLSSLISPCLPPSPSTSPWPRNLYHYDHQATITSYINMHTTITISINIFSLNLTSRRSKLVHRQLSMVNLAFCFRRCCSTCVRFSFSFSFHFSNRVLKSKSTRQRWHQAWYLQNETIARTIMLLWMRPRFHDSRFYVNYVWQRALDTRKFSVSR